ncbi:hypothetical protein FEM48_Zijuj02G0065500 [Ziziphus jujuba var. spinosa]|uniref:UDP-glycosyltransferase 76F1-like n=1 Tax=Ziziphus jujuba var. spinosa TaxID=714518 RepID=A0A978VU69_ZIZJJ|nr:hypothetical protein FEM48_Zijuj02G0065500 [Ziziphus jujuba var. spinosa]
MRKESQSGDQWPLVLVPCPYQGHINPMLHLGKILHSKGFSITIAHTNFNSADPQSHPEFSFLPILDGLSDHEISTGIHIISTINVNCKLSFQQLLESHNNIFSCIIFDELMHFRQTVAANLKLPCVTLSTNNFATFLSRSALCQLIGEGQIPFQDSRSQEMVPKLEPLRFKDLPIPRSPDLNGFVQLMAEAYKIVNSLGVIWNTIDCLEQPYLMQIQQKFCWAPIFPIGPLHKIAPHTSGSLLKEDRSCIPWLDKKSRNSVVYVSFGSVASIGEKLKRWLGVGQQ